MHQDFGSTNGDSGREPRIPVPFLMGRLLITPGARDAIDYASVVGGVRRHVRGDWGELCAEDKAANDAALQHGARLLSAYRGRDGTKFWIITEADRESTTVLLPDEY